MIHTLLIVWVICCFMIYVLSYKSDDDRLLKTIGMSVFIGAIILLMFTFGYNRGQEDASNNIHPGSTHKHYWMNKKIVDIP